MQDIADEMGATPVNNELAVGFDARLEHRFVYRQWAGQFFLLLVILSALLGRGPNSCAVAQTPGGKSARGL